MSIERHACFESQSVTSAESSRLCTELFHSLPEPLSILALYEYFVSERLTGISCLGNICLMSFKIYMIESVLPRLCNSCAACEDHHELFALRALNCDGSPVRCDVGKSAVKVLDDFVEMLKVFVSVSCIDDQQITVFGEAIEVSVIDSLALLVRDDAVLSLVYIKGLNVAGKYMLEELDHIRSFNDKSSHVGYIEDGAEMSCVKMLVNDSLRILDRHFPASEVDHFSAFCDMYVIQLCTFKFCHCFFLSPYIN